MYGTICILESLVGHYGQKFEDNSRLQVVISIKWQVKEEKEKINTLARGAMTLGRDEHDCRDAQLSGFREKLNG